MAGLPEAERAKRHLIVELDALGFALVSKMEDPQGGLTFDLLSSTYEEVLIGHEKGVVTIDVSESDPSEREKVRVALDEPYRTMLGHFRHEFGHYFQWQHVRGDARESCRALFGDDTAPYEDAIERHYSDGPPKDWEQTYISAYATMHPFEDFAETFAHFLHIRDTIDTAVDRGLIRADPKGYPSFSDLIGQVWIPLSAALNQINRSMGREDLYPFVTPPTVLKKLDFVASLMSPTSTYFNPAVVNRD